MKGFNKVILMGNLTRDPQVRYIPSGTAVADIGLAVNRSWFDKQTNSRKEDVTFVDVTLWGRQAEVAGEYLSKGRAVLIEGRLQLDQWEDRESGQKRSRLKVIGENMTMVSGGQGGGGGAPRGNPPSQSASTQEAPKDFDDAPAGNAPAGNMPNDDVPF